MTEPNDQPDRIIRFTPVQEPWFEFPQRTSSLQLETEGYVMMRETVRYVSIEPEKLSPRQQHQLMRRLHRAARLARRWPENEMWRKLARDIAWQDRPTPRPGDVFPIRLHRGGYGQATAP